MNSVIVKSVHGTVMEHYYPFDMETEATKQGALTDTYAVIFIQDSHTGGFGVTFAENQFCKEVLTLYFDDIVTEVDESVLFEDDMAESIIDFIEQYKTMVDTLLVHCAMPVSQDHMLLVHLLLRCLAAIIVNILRVVF